MNKKNCFEKFKDKEFPKEVQETLESFAKCGLQFDENNNEYWFRAGFRAREFTKSEEFIMVRKRDINLEWYKKIREELKSEEN
jgi:hypothetical protein